MHRGSDDFEDEEEMKQLRNQRQGKKRRDEDLNSPQVVEQEPAGRNEDADLMAMYALPTSFGGSRKALPSRKEDKSLLSKTKRESPAASSNPIPNKKLAVGPQRPQAPKQSDEHEDTVGPPKPQSLSEDEEMIGPPKPSSIQDTTEDDEMIGPPRPKFLNQPSESNGEAGEDEQMEVFEDEETNRYNIPYSHEIILKNAHNRAISSVALDPSGSRLLTGSHDFTVCFWDFAGMDSSLRSFRNVTPSDGNQIKSLQYSATGDKFLVATANSQPKFYDRDGKQLGECVKGDMYLTDMANTRGHVGSVGNAVWNPSNKESFMSCSVDSTIRIWDVSWVDKKQTTVIKAKDEAGRKTGVTYCSYNHDGTKIFGGCQDGSIQMWPAKGPFNRPNHIIRPGHFGGDITCLAFSDDGYTVASRSMDDTMKVWDLRNLKSVVVSFNDLPNYGDTDCMFSPDGRLLVTGTSIKKGEGTGLLVFYDTTMWQRVKQIGVSNGAGVISMLWHPKINQIVVGTSNGQTHVYFDPKSSMNGALLCASRAVREKDPNDYEPPRPILTPHALPLFYETPNSQRKFAKERYNPKAHAKLEAPNPNGKGKDGKLGSSVTQHLMKHYIKKDTSREEDPREALLKYAHVDSKPYFFKAYTETQPVPKFDTSSQPEPGIAKPEQK